MNKYEIIKKIENFAPLSTAEPWDPSGWVVETKQQNVSKIMLCLTPTDDVVFQAKNSGCDMIVSHHPSFFVPQTWCDIDIYSAHTNLDKANGGTTDTLIAALGLDDFRMNFEHEFLRFVKFPSGITVDKFSKIIAKNFPSARVVNNRQIKGLSEVAFCAGSGADFINEAKNYGADSLVTGDLKFHTALDSEIVIYDIGHFESEIIVLPVLENILADGVEIVFAQETSPFNFVCSD